MGGSAPAQREILGRRTWAVVAVTAALWATISPIALYLSEPYGDLSFRERLDSLSPTLGPSTAFTYMVASLAALAAYRLTRVAWLRGLLGGIALLSGFVAAFGLFDVWHFLTIQIHNFNDPNASLSLALQQSQWQMRVSGVMWGGAAFGLAAVTIWLTFPVATERVEVDADEVDDSPPEPVGLTPAG